MKRNGSLSAGNGDHFVPKSQNREMHKSSKVDIKEIRKKFENLNCENGNSVCDKQISCTPTPIAPARKTRNKCLSNDGKVKSVNSPRKFGELGEIRTNIVNSSSAAVSVRERTKLFESPKEREKLKQNRHTFHMGSVSEMSKSIVASNNEICANGGKTSQCVTPPIKPPRSFVHSEKSRDRSVETSSKGEVSKISNLKRVKGKRENLYEEIQDAGQSTALSLVNSEPPSVVEKPLNAQELSLHTGQQISELTPKPHVSSSKTQGILNYFKNLSSTASNLREKVKQKQSSIFVDLTPTTVSPPKHYGTLKRSHSEEHIYAEPNICKSQSKKLPENINGASAPLHYMCSPVVHSSSVPPEVKVEEKNKYSRLSVRSMIYDSFSVLRTSKDSTESAEVTSNDGSETDVPVKAIEDRIIYVKSVRKQISSTSLCVSPKLFEALLIVNISEHQPEASYSFPSKIPDAYNYPLLPHICFPDACYFKKNAVYQSETFHFSVPDKEENIFGYCLRIQGWPEKELGGQSLCVKLPVAICILSSCSAAVFYKKILLEIEKHLTLPWEKFSKYISSLRKLGVPNAGASLSIPDYAEKEKENRVVISRPLDSHIVGFELTRALQLLDVDILVKLVASLILERRVLFLSDSACNLYQCSLAISSLLYPFEWPHLIIPVLPSCLTVHCFSESPYILGISSSNSSAVLELLDEHELLIIDVDRGMIIKSCNDEDTILPRKVQKAVISALNLAKNMTDPTEMLRDVMISEAFVHMFVEMIGHYENHLVEVNGNLTFNKEGLLKNAYSHNIRSFLQWFSETQMFDTFVEESLWRIKYRNICQTNLRTFFEKRIDDYNWELFHDGDKLSRIIGKTVRNFGEKIRGLKKM